ncbi:MAG TPA: cation:proton antiporter [Gemmatimonadales bacterium]|nr:cation:proton antiporter [Gemmatimonadales bacterium]
MRWLTSLAALGAVMIVLHRLTATGPVEARATLALGFLALAAFLTGEMVHEAGLPRATGYLVIGYIVGPGWTNLVRPDELSLLEMVEQAVVACVAFGVGGMLTREAMRRHGRATLRAALGAFVFPFIVVTVVVLSVAPWFPLTEHEPPGDMLAVALALGVLAGGACPVITLAVAKDDGADGPVTRGTLLIAAALDVILLLAFPLVLLVARPLASPGTVDLRVALHSLAFTAAGIAVGGALGFVLARFERRVPQQAGFLFIAFAAIVAVLAATTGLEPMLVAAAAGAWVANLEPDSYQRLSGALGRWNLPVSVLLFVLLGAAFRLEALADLWPWALLLAGLRIVSTRYGLLWAGRDTLVPPTIARVGWLTLVPQGMVAAVVALEARRAFPEWGVSFAALAVALIAGYQVAGPICLKRALARVGEVSEGDHVAEADVARGAGAALGGGL